jgi:hypothetical protein
VQVRVCVPHFPHAIELSPLHVEGTHVGYPAYPVSHALHADPAYLVAQEQVPVCALHVP